MKKAMLFVFLTTMMTANAQLKVNCNGNVFIKDSLQDNHAILSEEDMGESYYIIENNTAYTSQEIPQGNYVVSVTKTGYIPAIMRFSTDTFFLQNEQLSTNVSFLANRVYIGSDVTSEKSVGPVSITAGKTNIQVSSWLDIKNDFEVKQGAMFEVKVVN